MEATQLKQIVNSEPDAKNVIEMLGERERFSRRTDLRRLFYKMKAEGRAEDQDLFMATWKRLQDQGLGSVVRGRGGNPDRFVWKYNLKDVAKAAQGEDITLNELPPRIKKRTTPKKQLTAKPQRRKRTIKAFGNDSISITLQVPTSVDMKDLSALLDLAHGLKQSNRG